MGLRNKIYNSLGYSSQAYLTQQCYADSSRVVGMFAFGGHSITQRLVVEFVTYKEMCPPDFLAPTRARVAGQGLRREASDWK